MVGSAQKFQIDQTVPFGMRCTLLPPPAGVQMCLSPKESDSVDEFPARGASQEESRPLNYVNK